MNKKIGLKLHVLLATAVLATFLLSPVTAPLTAPVTNGTCPSASGQACGG
ncbi:MAG TPA: hypothetical protein PLD25_02710 [Chloroflexota bacterium]|nr:hypothetical protein [Chloroflexota bacterium]HUM70505.1 hypothetical protein [Chloroflexota bacterium]